MRTHQPILLICSLALFVAACGRNAALEAYDAEPLYQADFSGFYLADALTGEELAARNADKLFTPASNTKLLTLATALVWLPADSLPVLVHEVEADTLRLWGLAYPELGVNTLAYNGRIRRAILDWPGTVEVSLHGFASLPRFGEGWMWDDYNYEFSKERSGLPVYANSVSAWRDAAGEWTSQPAFFVVREMDQGRPGTIVRDEVSNRYYVRAPDNGTDTLHAPLYNVAGLTAQLLEDFAGRSVRYHNKPLPTNWKQRSWHGLPRDSLLRRMMLVSDNFLAEQLFLQAALYGRNLTTPQSSRSSARDELLGLNDDELAWADAAGISHYNLVTPRALVMVVRDIVTVNGAVSEERLQLFPSGGQSGTISEWYAGADSKDDVFVWAKTGTLRHNHALSGVLKSRSGRYLAFSLMHNHFRGGSAEYKEAMSRTLATLREAY